MNWNFLITFFGGIGLYILVALIVGFIKRHKNKKKIEQEDKEYQEVQDNEKDKQ